MGNTAGRKLSQNTVAKQPDWHTPGSLMALAACREIHQKRRVQCVVSGQVMPAARRSC